MGLKIQSPPSGKTSHEYILLRVICNCHYYVTYLNYISESKEIMLF